MIWSIDLVYVGCTVKELMMPTSWTSKSPHTPQAVIGVLAAAVLATITEPLGPRGTIRVLGGRPIPVPGDIKPQYASLIRVH